MQSLLEFERKCSKVFWWKDLAARAVFSKRSSGEPTSGRSAHLGPTKCKEPSCGPTPQGSLFGGVWGVVYWGGMGAL